VDTLHITSPDVVVQLDCRNQYVNYPPITPDFTVDYAGWTFNKKVVFFNRRLVGKGEAVYDIVLTFLECFQ
jgi:hypothetical protein